MPKIGGGEIIIILLVVILLFGAKKLPELARSLGSSAREFRKGVGEGRLGDDEDGAAGDAPARGVVAEGAEGGVVAGRPAGDEGVVEEVRGVGEGVGAGGVDRGSDGGWRVHGPEGGDGRVVRDGLRPRKTRGGSDIGGGAHLPAKFAVAGDDVHRRSAADLADIEGRSRRVD